MKFLKADHEEEEESIPVVLAANLRYLSTTALPAVTSFCRFTCELIDLMLLHIEQ